MLTIKKSALGVDNQDFSCYNTSIETNKPRKVTQMKNIVSILAVVAATAGAANAGAITPSGDLDLPKWNGEISNNAIPDICAFTYNDANAGSMTYDIELGKWSVTTPAVVAVEHRGASELTVTAGDLIRTDASQANMAVVVDYTGSTITGDGTLSLADTAKISVGDLTDNSAAKQTVINIGGSAQMENTDVETNGIENGGKYMIVHTVQCLQ